MKTKSLKEFAFSVLVLFSVGLNVGFLTDVIADLAGPEPSADAQVVIVSRPEQAQPQNWDVFITALAWVESRYDCDAVSDRQAVGYLQVTPILVEDANRIVGREVFTMEGRHDRQESIRLFNVIQDHYNPEHDMQLALKIWNPRSKLSYHTAVMKKYNELILQKI